MGERVRIGTRASALALRQAETVARGLEAAWPGLSAEIVPIRTSGDRLATAHLAQVGGKGLFVKEIEEALLDGRIEVAVHSLKDLPGQIAGGLTLAAFPPREDPRDALVSREGVGLGGLPRRARVGTSSPRRRVQLLARRPDVLPEPIRGNVETRLRKLDAGDYDALVLAAAGLRRLGLSPPGLVVLEADEMLPAVGQGTLAVETREDDAATRRRAAALDDAATRAATLAERAFLESMGGSCVTPLAGHAWLEAGTLWLRTFLASPDGTRVLAERQALRSGESPADLGRRVAERMRANGAADLIAAGEAA